MIPEDIDAVAVGDSVSVTDGGRQRRTATVAKIGRTLVHIDDGYGNTTAYRRDTRQRRDGWPGAFRTLARRADDERRAGVMPRIAAHGIEWKPGRSSDWTTAQLVKLADAIERIKGIEVEL